MATTIVGWHIPRNRYISDIPTRSVLIVQGWITTTSGDPAMTKDLDMSYKNLVASGNASGIELVDTPEAIIRHVPHLKNAKGLETWKGIWNRNAGWVHARNALEKLGDEVTYSTVSSEGILTVHRPRSSV